MKPSKTGYSESMEIMMDNGLKKWVKSWYEVEMDENDNPDECHEHCKNKVQGWNKNPLSVQEFTYREPPAPPPVRDLAWEREMIQAETAIENATGLDVLVRLHENAIKFGLMDLYNEKLSSLKSTQ